MEQEIMDKPYQSFVDDTFSTSNINRCEERIFSLQTKLDKAVANNDIPSIRETFNLLGKNSQAVKILAVHRITYRNQGKYTAGVDGVKLPETDKATQDQFRLKLLEEIDILRKPNPIRRTFIPKPNGELRPLGIPTLKDRINQEILRIAIEPIAEYHFNHNSWGFRPKRCCQDAIEQLFNKLSRFYSPQYIIEGDIKGCFDNINHNHIIETLKNWKIPNWATELILKMLKSGIFYNGEITASETGTPQGGVISPLLANVALTSLDNFCSERYGTTNYHKGQKSRVNPIVRYADDFVIVCKTYEQATKIKAEISEHLSSNIGLTLSESKTNITHITSGFNFLGFNIKKHLKREIPKNSQFKGKMENYKLLIKPQKEKVVQFLAGCSKYLNDNQSSKQVKIIKDLNSKLIGWGMYYRFVVSKEIFHNVDYKLWWKLFNWSKRRHPRKSTGWILNRYFTNRAKRSKEFKDSESQIALFRLNSIPIGKRFVRLNNQFRVYENTPESKEYWNKREYKNAFDQITSVKIRKLYSKQQGKCSICKRQITQKQIENSEHHIHHQLPRSLGGTESHSNLRLLHQECHRELHALLTRQELKEIWKLNSDYLSKPDVLKSLLS